MKRPLFFLVCLAVAGCGDTSKEETLAVSTPVEGSSAPTFDPVEAANVSGVSTFIGEAPARAPIVLRGNPECAALHQDGSVLSEEIMVKDGKLQNVFVYVKEGLEGRRFPLPAGPAVVSNKGCVYVPHVLGVRTGQQVLILNEDATLHNVHSYSKNSKPFNLGLPFQGMKQTKVFDKAEVMVPLKCDVHPWMSGFIGVVDHPYFSVTDEAGRFELKGLPPGKYKVEAWHEKLGAQSQSIEIGPRESKTAEFAFNAAS